VLARCFEEAGISTTGVVFVKEHAERTKPPRMLWVPYAFGNALGRPGDPLIQHQILKAAFDLLDAKQGPALEEFEDDAEPEDLLQASGAPRTEAAKGLNAADELTSLRPYYERWVEKNGGRTAVGISGVPQRRFRGMVRFLEAYTAGEDADYSKRREGVGTPQFIRYCVDDLKAFYYEARMEQRPGAADSDIHEWYWSETAMSALIVKLAEAMSQSEDPAVKAIPYGLAR
jgi:hypothetical protein